MSTRTAITIVGGIVGAYFGYPQLGLVIGGLIGGAVDPQQIQGPKIGEVNVQTSQEGAPRTIIYGTVACYGNIIQTGQVVKIEETESQGKGGGPEVTSERALRTFAIRVCEGSITAYLRVWEDNKLVYDVRPGSGMIAESEKWLGNKVFYYGTEDQLPDPTLVATVNSDTPSYRGSAYMVAVSEDVTDRRGSIAQYRFEVAQNATEPSIGAFIADVTIPTPTGPFYPAVQIYRDYSESNLGKVVAGTYVDSVLSPATSDFYTLLTLGESGETIASQNIPLTGVNWAIQSVPNLTPRSYYGPYAVSMTNSNAGNNILFSANGILVAGLKPNNSFANDWYEGVTGATYTSDGRRMWFTPTDVYVGTVVSDGVNVNNFCKWSLGAGSFPALAGAILTNVCVTPGTEFFTHLDYEAGVIRIINDVRDMKTYDLDLNLLSTVSVSSFTSGASFSGFGVEGDNAIFVYTSAPQPRMEVRKISDLTAIVSSDVRGSFTKGNNTRVCFTDTRVYIQVENEVLVYENIKASGGVPILLSEIVSDIHERCGSDSVNYDVSELDDLVAGFSLAGDYTGASAIDSLRPVYFFDKSEHDKKLWYPKRGAAVIETLTIDDLTEIPDTTTREQAIEVPKKLHLRYQHAASGYAPVKATASSSSPDMLTTGEAALEVAVVLNEDQAAQTVDKMYKVTKSEIRGTTEITVPLNIGAKYVAGNCLGLALRDRVTRERIEQQDFIDGKIKLVLKPDRQSAYTSDLTGVPIPDPTPPPSTIVGPTELAVLDISARVDSEDDLNYLVAVSGALPPWYGARYQRSLDEGASYTTVLDIQQASIMGEITSPVADASEYFTDTTNTVTVELYRENQELDSITETQFLSEGGAFALEKADGSWEIMQYLDAVEDSNGAFTLSTLHRGLLNSGTSSHSVGARLVMLQRPSHIPAQSSWIGQDLTHRAISLGESADDTFNEQTETFVGRSQIEWPVAYLELTRSGSNISATWTPRHRFGTDDNPIASINFQGYRVTIDGGSNGSVTFDTTTAGFTNYNASAYGGGLTVTVSSLNRITGPGPGTSGII